MINWTDIINKLRGVRDQQVNMYLIMRQAILDAEQERKNFLEFVKYRNDYEEWEKENEKYAVTNEGPYLAPRIGEHIKDYTKFLKDHGEFECFSILRDRINKAQDELYKWIDDASEQYNGLRGKILCIEDYQQHGMRWITNEVLIGNLYCRLLQEGKNEHTHMNVLGYTVMASYLTGRDLLKKKWKDTDNEYGVDVYGYLLNDIEKYNLRIT